MHYGLCRAGERSKVSSIVEVTLCHLQLVNNLGEVGEGGREGSMEVGEGGEGLGGSFIFFSFLYCVCVCVCVCVCACVCVCWCLIYTATWRVGVI